MTDRQAKAITLKLKRLNRFEEQLEAIAAVQAGHILQDIEDSIWGAMFSAVGIPRQFLERDEIVLEPTAETARRVARAVNAIYGAQIRMPSILPLVIEG